MEQGKDVSTPSREGASQQNHHPKSLCFIEAYEEKQAGNITEEEYFRHIFAHLHGVEHEGEERHDWDHGYRIEKLDPVGFIVHCWWQNVELSPTEDLTPFLEVFRAYRTGDIAQLAEVTDALTTHPAPYVRESPSYINYMVALLALKERNATTLRWSLDRGGFGYGHLFEEEADKVNPNIEPEIFAILEESEFRVQYPRLPPRTLEEMENDPLWAMTDRGGLYPIPW